MALIWKRGIFDLLFTFSSHQGKTQKFYQHICHLQKHTYFAHPIDFFVLSILQKFWIYHEWFLFGATTGVDSHLRQFEAINNNMVSKI